MKKRFLRDRRSIILESFDRNRKVKGVTVYQIPTRSVGRVKKTNKHIIWKSKFPIGIGISHQSQYEPIVNLSSQTDKPFI